MRFCPWILTLLGRVRRYPKRRVSYVPIPRIEPPHITDDPKLLRELRKTLYRCGPPGTTFVGRDGREYIVQKDGSWKRTGR